jgi:hypothetical protein
MPPDFKAFEHRALVNGLDDYARDLLSYDPQEIDYSIIERAAELMREAAPMLRKMAA